MKIIISLIAICFAGVTVAHEYAVLPSYTYPLSYSSYALGYPHLANTRTVLLTQPQFHYQTVTTDFALKHHTPEHKEEGGENQDIKEGLPTLKLYQPAGIPLAYSSLPHSSLPIPYSGSVQYHSQDELGQYHYGYSNQLSSKTESKTLDGITRGAYSYVDSEGKLQSVNYVSDALGFRVAATNLPKAPEAPLSFQPAAENILVAPIESPEIIAARAAHLQAHENARELLRQANIEDGANEKLEEKKLEDSTADETKNE